MESMSTTLFNTESEINEEKEIEKEMKFFVSVECLHGKFIEKSDSSGLRDKQGVTSMCWYELGGMRYVGLTTCSGWVKILNLETFLVEDTIEIHDNGWLEEICFVKWEDENLLLCAGFGTNVTTINLSNKIQKTIKFESSVMHICILGRLDSEYFAVGNDDGIIFVCKKYEKLYNLKDHNQRVIKLLVLKKTPQILVSGGGNYLQNMNDLDFSIRFWEWEEHSKKIVKKLEGVHQDDVTAMDSFINKIENKEYLVSGTYRYIFIWDVETGKSIRTIGFDFLNWFRDVVGWNGMFIMTMSGSSELDVVNVMEGKPITKLKRYCKSGIFCKCWDLKDRGVFYTASLGGEVTRYKIRDFISEGLEGSELDDEKERREFLLMGDDENDMIESLIPNRKKIKIGSYSFVLPFQFWLVY